MKILVKIEAISGRYLGLFLVAFVSLITELNLTRIIEVAIGANLAYMIITCAIFAFGLAGIVITFVGLPHSKNTDKFLFYAAVSLAASILLILPLMQLLSIQTMTLTLKPPIVDTFISFSALYLIIAIPFFIAGLIVTILMAKYPKRVRRLYFWDLTGAALGCVLVAPLIPVIGPNGILLLSSAFALLAAGLFFKTRIVGCSILALGLMLSAVLFPEKYFPFLDQIGDKYSQVENTLEFTRWDPISKIDVIGARRNHVSDSEAKYTLKSISYDGGRQHSSLVAFSGDFKSLRGNIDLLQDSFVRPAVVASHYLKRNTRQRVLNIGSAGGNEVRAALMYGAAHIDAVELVPTVVELVEGQYADYIGNIFGNPRVDVYAREGRSFLRSTDEKYDIIQIYSNHTSSSIASGTGAMATGYLWTVEAFKEYFGHLSKNGILHINQLFYPRLITAAAAAWKQMGRINFQEHVVVLELAEDDWQPAFFVKNEPWTEDEMNDLLAFISQFNIPHAGEIYRYRLSENPLDPSKSFLSKEFFSGQISKQLETLVPYRIVPITDDTPYFMYVRKNWKNPRLEPNANYFLSDVIAKHLNGMRLGRHLTKDSLHLVLTAIVSLFYAVIFILMPLYFSKAGTAQWPGKKFSLLYFSCLGAGFIILELVLIHIFMHFIGNPVYTYATTLFCLLLGAGLGSLSSGALKISINGRWTWPFLGILVIGLIFTIIRTELFYLFLGESVWVRIVVSALIMIPLGFFLGIPFPLGIQVLEKNARSAIPWAWGLNGFFTVIGGFLSVLLSVFIGFTAVFFIGLAIYALAFWMFSQMRQAMIAPTSESKLCSS